MSQIVGAIAMLGIVAAVVLILALRRSSRQEHFATSIPVDTTTYLPAAISEAGSSALLWRTRFIADDVQQQAEKPPRRPNADDERLRIMYYQTCVQYGIAATCVRCSGSPSSIDT